MLLSAEGLAARRGEELIFSNLSFDLGMGEALVVTGRNGSGKSTLLRVIAGLLAPEAGRVTFSGAGVEPGARPREFCHYLGHRNAMKRELTVFENLAFWKSFQGGSGGALDIDEAAETVGLGGILHLPYGYLSAGQQRRFAIARLLVAHRPVWLLDEPTAALDADSDRMFAGLVKRHLAEGGIALATTHQPLGLEKVQELRMTGFSGVNADVWE